MKFNWGHGIVVVIVAGVLGLLSLMFITTRQRIDMVTDDYYPKELKYEDQISKIKNYKALAKKVTVEQKGGVLITFPDNIADADDIKGSVHLYRPSDKSLDIEMPVKLNEAYRMLLPLEAFKKGKYEVIIEWQANGQPYLTRQVLYID
ncbi:MULTISPECIES: FixH family protein [unclassified Carboxylicivirga]|uniref:FixH family protein n=1 Tax=Carboxylicivirga TaxID=1628153 RepID=UPI003D344DF9